ncbi:MAG: DUF1566 domain-containing protein [Saprospiraceae bacterium]|nr:DUF1566 domain-containing protein [Saprospiraceae bacterium]
MKKAIIIVSILLGYLLNSTAQQGVQIGEVFVLATEMTEAQRNAIASPATDLLIYQTDGTMGLYYYSGTVWIFLPNPCPPPPPAPTVAIGDTIYGGIVFWVDPTDNTKGKVCAMTDQGTAIWGCYGTELQGAESYITGNVNTLDILAGCSTPGIAADLCASYTGAGFDDWYLPSKDELNLMYTNLHDASPSLGGFANDTYWSSTENTNNRSTGTGFSSGFYYNGNKYLALYVRAVRAF